MEHLIAASDATLAPPANLPKEARAKKSTKAGRKLAPAAPVVPAKDHDQPWSEVVKRGRRAPKVTRAKKALKEVARAASFLFLPVPRSPGETRRDGRRGTAAGHSSHTCLAYGRHRLLSLFLLLVCNIITMKYT
ncbi:hypothetical protein ACJJTC_011334 [Scirpophaga incertulas]